MKTSEIRLLNENEIGIKIFALKHELFNLRFQKGIGQLENPAKMKQNRKAIARLKTILTEMAHKTHGKSN